MVLPSFILLPLYIYPVINGSPTWTFLFETIEAYPDLLFNVIVNQQSGPGVLDSQGCPTDLNYLTAIANLTTYENTNLLGYVRTGWNADPPIVGGRDISEVESEVSTWLEYSSCPTSDVKIDGIFFDEAANIYNKTTSAYMKQITDFARSASTTGSSVYPIVFNPGTPADTRFFAYPDNILMREDFGSNTDNVTSIAVDSIPATERANSSILFHDWTALTQEIQTASVNQVVEAGVAGFSITTTTYNETNTDTLWPDFAEAMNAAVQAQ